MYSTKFSIGTSGNYILLDNFFKFLNFPSLEIIYKFHRRGRARAGMVFGHDGRAPPRAGHPDDHTERSCRHRQISALALLEEHENRSGFPFRAPERGSLAFWLRACIRRIGYFAQLRKPPEVVDFGGNYGA